MLAELSFLNGRIAITEIAWTIIGIIGFYVNALNWKEAQTDLDLLLILKKNGWMKRIAKQNISSNRNRCLVNATVIVAGIAAMTQPASRPAVPVTATGVVITVALFIIVIISIINPIQERRLRRGLMTEPTHDIRQTKGE